MTKHRLGYILVAMMASAVPVFAETMPMESMVISNDIQQSFEELKITLNGKHIMVTGANGLTRDVVSFTVKPVMNPVRIDGQVQSVELNLPKGCYLVKVGKVVRKISIAS